MTLLIPTRRLLPTAWLAIAVLGVSAVTLAAQAPGDSASVRDLPLLEVPAAAGRGDGHLFAILLSGDGGWASIDKQLAAELAARGVSVVGFDLRQYLGTERTPAETAGAVARVIRAYEQKWNSDSVAIVGFSRGANIAPFVVARLPENLRAHVRHMALIGLATAANFKWHWQDVIRDVKRDSDLPVRPELDRITGVPTLCIFGSEEKESGCRNTPAGVTRVERPGGHHQDGDYTAVADIVVNALRR